MASFFGPSEKLELFIPWWLDNRVEADGLRIGKMIDMCSNGTDTQNLAEDERFVLSTETGYLTPEEAEVAIDIAQYVEGLCQSEALDLDYFVGHLGDAPECSDIMLTMRSVHINKEVSKLDYYAKSALVLHDEDSRRCLDPTTCVDGGMRLVGGVWVPID